MKRTVTWGFVALLCSLGCDSDLKDPSLITDLSVLALRADPPEVQTDSAVELDALMADPQGDGRLLEFFWGLCTFESFQDPSDCNRESALPLASTQSATIEVPAGTLDAVPEELLVVGVDVFLFFQVTADNDSATAIKRVRVSFSPQPNTNPTIDSLRVNESEESPTILSFSESIALTVNPTSESLETHEGPNGPTQEEMRYTWLTTAGAMDQRVSFGNLTDGSSGNTWDPDEDVETSTIWVIIRDQRGGTAWITRQIQGPSP